MAKRVVAKMLERRILINRTSETVLRFLPPYIMGAGQRGSGRLRIERHLTEEGAGLHSLAAAHQNTGGSRNG